MTCPLPPSLLLSNAMRAFKDDIEGEERSAPFPRQDGRGKKEREKKKGKDRSFPAERRNQKAQLERGRSAPE